MLDRRSAGGELGGHADDGERNSSSYFLENVRMTSTENAHGHLLAEGQSMAVADQ